MLGPHTEAKIEMDPLLLASQQLGLCRNCCISLLVPPDLENFACCWHWSTGVQFYIAPDARDRFTMLGFISPLLQQPLTHLSSAPPSLQQRPLLFFCSVVLVTMRHYESARVDVPVQSLTLHHQDYETLLPGCSPTDPRNKRFNPMASPALGMSERGLHAQHETMLRARTVCIEQERCRHAGLHSHAMKDTTR